MDPHFVDSPSTPTLRPGWVLWCMALPVAVLLSSIVSEELSSVGSMLSHHILVWVGGPLDPSAAQKVMVKFIAHAAIPWLVVAALFKVLRFDALMAPNPLSMAFFGLFNVIYVGQWVYRLYMASTGGIPFVSGWPGDVLPHLLWFALLGGWAALLMSTAWHRGVLSKWMGTDRFRHLWAEM